MHLEYDASPLFAPAPDAEEEEEEAGLPGLDPAPPPPLASDQFERLLTLHRLESQQYDRVPDPARRDLLIKTFYSLKHAAFLNLGKLELDINEEKLTAELRYSSSILSESGRGDAPDQPPLLRTFIELSDRFGPFLVTADQDIFTICLHADLARSIKVRDYSEQIEALRHPPR